jgi:hypothetical protein
MTINATTAQAQMTLIFFTGDTQMYVVDREDLDRVLKAFEGAGPVDQVVEFLADDRVNIRLNLAVIAGIRTYPPQVRWELRTNAPANDVHEAIADADNADLEGLKANPDGDNPGTWVVAQRGLAERAPYALRNVAAYLIGNGYAAELAAV